MVIKKYTKQEKKNQDDELAKLSLATTCIMWNKTWAVNFELTSFIFIEKLYACIL